MIFLHSLWPSRITLGALVLLETLGGLRLIPIQTEFTWKGLIMQSVAALIVFELLDLFVQKKRLNISVGILSSFLTLQIVVDAFGDMFHFYGRYLGYDQLLHLTGGFVVSLITTSVILALQRKRRRRIFRQEVAMFGLSAAGLASILYEAEEYLEDLLTGSRRLGDGFDTADDLILGVLGAILASALVVRYPRFTERT